MAVAAPSPLASSVQKTNGAKLSRLLIDGGTTTLRNVEWCDMASSVEKTNAAKLNRLLIDGGTIALRKAE